MGLLSWLLFLGGVSAMTLGQIFLSRANASGAIPLWWGNPTMDPPRVTLGRSFGGIAAAAGAYFASQTMGLHPLGTLAIIAGGMIPPIAVAIIHNLRISHSAGMQNP